MDKQQSQCGNPWQRIYSAVKGLNLNQTILRLAISKCVKWSPESVMPLTSRGEKWFIIVLWKFLNVEMDLQFEVDVKLKLF